MSHDPYEAIATHLFPQGRLKARARLTGGVSADVHRLDVTLVDDSTTSVVMRAQGATYSGHSAELEFRLLQALHREGVPVPKPLLVDVSGGLVKEPFLVMEFIEGASEVPVGEEETYIDMMGEVLASIHAAPTANLPVLPERNDPYPDVLGFMPEGKEWQPLCAHLRTLTDTAHSESPTLLHGDFWPENLLWRNDGLAAIIDWEDAAFGDPLSDVACSRVELRYKFGTVGMQRFTRAYSRHRAVNGDRLALWQVYVAAAAQRHMGEWGLAPALEAHMRRAALASIREAGAVLMGQATWEMVEMADS